MIRVAQQTPLIDALRAAGVFDAEPLVVLDAGCRGGIYKIWSRFGPSLIAHGFDPLVDECERLNAQETRPNVHYHARFVGLPPADPFVVRARLVGNVLNPWSRLSTARALGQASAGPATPPPDMADAASPIGLADFAVSQALPRVDFLKIDVDGADHEVLRSAAPLLEAGQVLGVSIEVNFWGAADDSANTFHNIDRYLRANGFALFGLETRHYSRADLPARFVNRFPAHTTFGAPLQGDALYFRDLAAPAASDEADARSGAALLKLAALYEGFRLPDCAAEVINVHRSRVASIVDPDALLDALVAGLEGSPTRSYVEYRRMFDEQSAEFFASPRRADQTSDAGMEALRSRVSELEKALARSQREASAADRAREKAQQKAAALTEARDRLKARLRHRESREPSA